MILISSYTDKKLVSYLRPGQKVLVRFGHGLGDTLMFLPILDQLRALYPGTQIDLYVESGQEQIWKSATDMNDPSYDYIFHLDFPMSEGSLEPKAAKCCRCEIGIEPVVDVAKLERYPNPLVAVHFNGTALPGSVGCSETVAAQIWQEIHEAGFIPIECHFEHVWHNPVNKQFPFVESTVRKSRPELKNLFGLLQNCHAFVGVASGPFVAALSIMPDRMFYLESAHKLECYTKLPVPRSNIKAYKAGTIKQWLQSTRS